MGNSITRNEEAFNGHPEYLTIKTIATKLRNMCASIPAHDYSEKGNIS